MGKKIKITPISLLAEEEMPPKKKISLSKVKKRDGRIVKFNQSKITKALTKAMRSVGEKDEKLVEQLSDRVVEIVEEKFDGFSIPSVEEIQDIVEMVLIESGQAEVAKAYILYRDLHARLRNIQSLIDSNELMAKYLDQTDWRVKENSNMSYSLQGLNNHVASAISANYWLNKIYPKAIRDAHSSGDFHIHDLQQLSAYCCGWDLQDFLRRGIVGVPGKIESKPPSHFRVALGQLTNLFYTLQGEAAGAQAVSSFDTLLAPFIYYDKLSWKEVKQALQEFVFNNNVPTRVGFQTPFTNVTLDLVPTGTLAAEAVIIGGKPQDKVYGDFQKEIDMFNKAFAEVMLEGDARGRVFTFPIPTYNVTKDFAWDNPEIEPIWEMTRKYGIPYFSNFVNSDMSPEDARSMCPLAGDEKVLIRSRRGRGLEYCEIRNIFEGNSKENEYEIYSDGKFIHGKFNKFNDKEMIKITLVNGHELKTSKDHLNFVLVDNKVEVLETEKLNDLMYLPYSLNTFEGEGGNYDLGFFVGAYAGDGSFDGDTTVVFSLENHYKKDVVSKLKEIGKKYFSAHIATKEYSDSKLFTLKIHSRAAVGLCRDFVEGIKKDKCYQANIFGTSLEFRRGVIDGHYATDGGNRHRIYTSSIKMAQTLNMLAATMGTTTAIYKDDREGRLGKEPNYALLFYQQDRKNYGDVWKKEGGRMWVKIEKIEKISNSTAYCFKVENGDPIFTVGTTGILTHNCRLRLDNRELRKKGGGLFGANPLTGSIGVVTINLARLGFLSSSREDFLAKLGCLMDLAKESLTIKREMVEGFTENGLYPYSKVYLENIKKRFGKYWQNHFGTIGLNGMNEACLNFLKKDIATEEGKEFAVAILEFMRERMRNYQKETNMLFNLEATPAEGTAYRFAKIDKDRYPQIIVANEKAWQEKKAAPYYTNSTHLPVGHTDDIFAALDHQDELQIKYTGGTVLHGFLGESMPDTKGVKSLVKKIAYGYRLPYFTLTPTFSVCPNHGYVAGEHHNCPKCEGEVACEVYSRVVGYLRPVGQWNAGKREEFFDRKTYDQQVQFIG